MAAFGVWAIGGDGARRLDFPGAALDRWKTTEPDDGGDGGSGACEECSDPAGFMCWYCSSWYCDAHLEDHGPGCDELAAADASADAQLDDERGRA